MLHITASGCGIAIYLGGPVDKLTLGLTAGGLVGTLASYVSNQEQRLRTKRILERLQWAYEKDGGMAKKLAEEQKYAIYCKHNFENSIRKRNFGL